MANPIEGNSPLCDRGVRLSLLVGSDAGMFELPKYEERKKSLRSNRANVGRSIRERVEIELSKYVFETLRKDGEFTHYRGRRNGSLSSILAVAPAAGYLGAESLERLKNAYALRHQLDPAWAARPQALVFYDGRPRLLIEDPGGDPLERLLGQPMELPHFLRIAISIAGALSGFHARGLVHRNIKPANILVNPFTAHAWLWGICLTSRLPRQPQATEPPKEIAGTLAYMAPEQTGRMNRPIDARSDLYSYGVTLYELLTGVLPFTATDAVEWVHCHIARQPMSPSERVKGIPEPVSAIIIKLLAKTPEERYQTAAGAEADLRQCLVASESGGRIDPFPLGTHDVPDALQIPEMLPEERSPTSLNATIGAPIEQLDIGTVVKASQAMSSEIVLSRLIETLLRIAVEHAGAAKGMLILLRDDGPQIEAEARASLGGVELTLRTAPVTPLDLPESVLHYVIRARQSVILEDATVQNMFSADEYVRRVRPRSTLCLPLLKQAKLVGVLYLENNLAPQVFTPSRLAMLELLATQAAISLENARLYDEREMLAQQRAAELARANEALRECLDALASVPELDEFLGQVMVAIARQLGAVSSTFAVVNREQNTLVVEFVYQAGRVMSPSEAQYPEVLRALSLDEQSCPQCLNSPISVWRILDPSSPVTELLRSYLRGLGIKTLLVIALAVGDQPEGRLAFHFTEERDFRPEEVEIARALATQASLAIQLTRLAKTARRSAVLEERNRLAGEIHDVLAQSFAGISVQLEVAEDETPVREGRLLSHIRQANEMAKFGLAEARRSLFRLRSSIAPETGFVAALQALVERSDVAGRLRCEFRSDRVPEEKLPARAQHELLRIAQEAISNGIRHAKPTVVAVALRWVPPNLTLEVTDNGSGIDQARLEKSEGLGLGSMRARASQIGGTFDIRTAASHGTTLVVTVPISS